ncbi:MAG: hypothetical protein HYT42_00365 [Candidatus Sungbacteria bacterium]|nr:hypothetical protein [Candidatus Sungbacteria bacterium]
MSYEGKLNPAEAGLERSGTLAEANMLGAIDAHNPLYQERAREWVSKNAGLLEKFRARRLSEREHNVLFNSAFHFIENLPENRSNPDRALNPDYPLLKDLRSALAAGGLELVGRAAKRVKAYSAVGSPVDFSLGVDGFLRIDGHDISQPPIYVTFDYTLNAGKDRTRADVLIKELPDPDEAEERYRAAVSQAAHQVFLQYLNKKRQRERQRGISIGK